MNKILNLLDMLLLVVKDFIISFYPNNPQNYVVMSCLELCESIILAPLLQKCYVSNALELPTNPH
jgi:hypothetical protein